MPQHRAIEIMRAYKLAQKRAKLVFKAIRLHTSISREEIIKKGGSRERSDARSIYVLLMSEDPNIEKQLIMQFIDRDRTNFYHNYYKAINLELHNVSFAKKIANVRTTLSMMLKTQKPVRVHA